MSEEKNGAQHLVEALQAAGVTTIFSLSGNQIMPVYDALIGSDIRLIHTRHEGAAVYMAEAHAQITGETGVALLTAGPGFANGLSAMYSARESETPMLVLSGDAPIATAGRGAFQEMDQQTPAASLGKASVSVSAPDGMFAAVSDAMALANRGRPGPVHISLHDDVLRQRAARGASSQQALPATSLDATIVERIKSAKRPLVIGGPSFARPDWEAAFTEAAGLSGIPMLALESPRGMKAPRIGALAGVLPEADLVVLLSLTPNFLLGFGQSPVFSASCIFICCHDDQQALDEARARLGADRVIAVPLSGADVVGHLTNDVRLDLLAGNATEAGWLARVEDAMSWRPAAWRDIAAAEAPFHAASVAYEVRRFLDKHPGGSLTIDGGEVGQWCQAILDARYSIINGPSGAIGGSIPYAMAAKAARPDQPSIVMLGDGTAGFYFMEFETALREELPIVALVGNDAKWNAEHQIQVRDYGADRAYGCEMTRLNYDDIAKAMGCYGENVTEISEIVPAIERAIASGKPACINVAIQSIPAPVISRS